MTLNTDISLIFENRNLKFNNFGILSNIKSNFTEFYRLHYKTLYPVEEVLEQEFNGLVQKLNKYISDNLSKLQKHGKLEVDRNSLFKEYLKGKTGYEFQVSVFYLLKIFEQILILSNIDFEVVVNDVYDRVLTIKYKGE